MRVVFDSQIFCRQQFGGISRYFVSLAQQMAAIPGVQARIVAPLHINEFAKDLPVGLVWGRKIRSSGKLNLLIGLASAVVGELVQYRVKPDIVHETYYYPQPRGPRDARRIVTIHDLAYRRYPEMFRVNSAIPGWMKSAVARADHVICVSEHTRRDLLEMYDIAPERVSVTHLGPGSLVSQPPEADPATVRARCSGLDKPYILYVGSRASYKNLAGLVRAFAASAWLRQTFALVCFGGGGFTAAEQALMAELDVVDCVRHVNGPDSTLAGCYRHAAVLVYPSLYEGFGIPPLEAMSLDCPVVCSNTSSIPEVVGDAAVTFDPADPEAIRAALEAVLSSESLREQLIERGRRRKELFSWERCARETLDVYRKTTLA
jgi:glycosyltransferase involved in cell wall biosynthesis